MSEWKPPKLDWTNCVVENEGCKLHYDYCGTGPLLIYIPGAGSQSKEFLSMVPYLKGQFTCVAYDRRQLYRSITTPDGTPMTFKRFNPVQHARDVIAIIIAMGQTKATIWGNSSGGLIALQVAASFPQRIEHIVIHEAPAASILPDADKWIDLVYSLCETFETTGLAAVMQDFRSYFKGFSADDPPTPNAADEDWDTCWRYEMLPVTTYVPDLERIKYNNVAIAIATGVKSGDAFYARTGAILARRIGCEEFKVPGHHSGHQCEPEAFSKALVDIFNSLRKD